MKFKIDSNFILDFQTGNYPYLEEVNAGILKQVSLEGAGAFILDVGAGRGALGEVLRARGYHVCIIESNAMAAMEATPRVDQVICADLHNIDEINQQLKNKKFKYIIFSDVLEHVYDPLHVLRQYIPLLEEQGKLLISLPNTVNWLNRFCIMWGLFNYKMTGVMDRTHIRFFTFKSAIKMLEASQCVVERVDSTPYIVRAFLPMIKILLNKTQSKITETDNIKYMVESPQYQLYKKYIYPIEYWITRLRPSLLAFNIILVAHKDLN